MFKNTASLKIQLFAFDTTTGAPKTGDAANITAYVSKDYGAVTVLGDTSATEIDATNAKGWYIFDLTQAETNADALLFTAKSSTANISVVGQTIYTLPASFTSFVTPPTAAVNAAAVWDMTTAGHTTAGTFGKNDVDIYGFLNTYLDGPNYSGAQNIIQAMDAIKAKTGLIPASPAAVSDIPTAIQNADTLLDRNMATGTDSGSPSVRTVRQALRFLRNKWTPTAGTLTVYKEDDTTASWTGAIATDAAAIPIVGIDPA